MFSLCQLIGKSAIVLTLVFLINSLHHSARAELRFELIKPNQIESVIGGFWSLNVEGEISDNDAVRFRKFVQDNQVPARTDVYINSPGGSLLEAMELAREFRELNVRISVGKTTISKNEKNESGLRSREYLPGECYSACTLAFVGGFFRFYRKGANTEYIDFISKIHLRMMLRNLK